MDCLYYTAVEVQELLGVSRGHAYKVVKKLNEELKQKGFIVIAGRIPKKYFAKKYYGMDTKQIGVTYGYQGRSDPLPICLF